LLKVVVRDKILEIFVKAYYIILSNCESETDLGMSYHFAVEMLIVVL